MKGKILLVKPWGGYVLENFTTACNQYLKSLLVAWQPHSDDKALYRLAQLEACRLS